VQISTRGGTTASPVISLAADDFVANPSLTLRKVSEGPLQARVPRPPLLHRVTPSQRLAVDLVVAGVVAVSALWQLMVAPPRSGLLGICLLVAAVAVAIRRRNDLASLGLMSAALAVSAAGSGSAAPFPLIALPMYQVASKRERGSSLPALAASAFLLIVGTAAGRVRNLPAGGLSFAIAFAVAAWFVGDSVRVRRVYVAGLADQAAQRQREVVERAQRSLAEERLRIARELHDVVAHSLSVIAVQSGVGRHVIDDNPAEAKKALGAVETTSRAALQELRRLLGVLRSNGNEEAALAPAPDLGALSHLADQIRATGIPVDLCVQMAPDTRLTPSAELSVYRVVQEALTNVVKHAGPASVQVNVHDEPDTLVVEVVDDGAGPIPAPYPSADPDVAGHHGILGMRERLALFGGTLDAGFRPEGGFKVRAELPLEAVER